MNTADDNLLKLTEEDRFLEGYRVLDLTQGGYLVCGQYLAQMGADVIVVEPPGGNPTRMQGPFYKGQVDPEKSLRWFAHNTNKRSLTLDLETHEGKEVFRRLTRTADVVLESFTPGYLENIGLGYNELRQVRSDLVMTSISGYGQSGPKSKDNCSDLTIWAASGMMYMSGDPDRPPLQAGWPQSELLTGVRAVGATNTALFHREMTGEGQQVDVSSQLAVAWANVSGVGLWECQKQLAKREGIYLRTRIVRPSMLPCQDGFVALSLWGGVAPGAADTATRIVKWMDEEGVCPESLKRLDWRTGFDPEKVTQEEYDSLTEPITKWLLTITKAEFDGQSVQRNIMGSAVYGVDDIARSGHLSSREYWVGLDHPELGDTLTYCGPTAKLSEAPMLITRRAPLIGEHSRLILEELGYGAEEIDDMKRRRVV